MLDKYKVPLVCGGDLLDRWNSPPELLNFLLDNLPSLTYAVRGNHDLPWHSHEEVAKSGYWTLVKAGRVVDLEPEHPLGLSEMVLHAFPWNSALQGCPEKHALDGRVHLAVVHKYVWKKGGAFPGAPKFGHYKQILERLPGYDAILAGDNHISLHHNLDRSKPGASLYNPGSLMVRKSDELEHRPSVGLLLGDGSIVPHYLDISQDVYLQHAGEEKKSKLQAQDFLESLGELGGDELDFKEAVKNALQENTGVGKLTRKLVLKALET